MQFISYPSLPALLETSMQDRQPSATSNTPSRRSFFAGAAAVGAGAAALAALPRVAPFEAELAEPARVAPEKGGGYHLSAHVKQYYKTTQL
jgi:hypothetical protein